MAAVLCAFVAETPVLAEVPVNQLRRGALIVETGHLTARNLPLAGEYQGAVDIVGNLWTCVHELHKYETNSQLVPTPAVVEMFRAHALNGEPGNRANVQQSVYIIASHLTWNDAPDARKMSARLFEALRDCGRPSVSLWRRSNHGKDHLRTCAS
ncbi:hypothetical protein OKW39_002524 [Paraburkholderia sp. MM6662-R1]